MMERRIVHYKHRSGFGLSAAMMEKLFDKVLKDSCIGITLKHTREENAVLIVGRQDLVPLASLETSNLNRRHS
jgi:hypothetical protein